MPDRAAEIRSFLDQTDWRDATPAPLAGDASNRKYLRLSRPSGDTAVLMDAPPESGEDTRPFIHIARYLCAQNLSAPQIYAHDEARGFLLLEDLGDALFARVIAADPTLEIPLYDAATDMLLDLHRCAPPDLPAYDADIMTDMAALAFDWYATGAGHPAPDARQEFHTAMHAALSQYAPETDVLILRDFHAENLLWLPDRTGTARVGLLDFQDAMLGHRAYDLLSMLQDARRDVPPEIEAQMIRRYVAASGVDMQHFTAAYHCLAAQRNLRILGVFARLCLRDGKPGYIDLIPRVWGLLQRDLTHPALAGIARILSASLPSPTPETLQILKDKCATHPAQ
jgi:aminoglycoside/choline kinase family phosphotransferase